MKKYIAVIQAGGKGTRMYPLTYDLIPKPLLKLNGKPLIQWQIENLAEYGINDFYIIVGHLGEKIEEYFHDGKKMGVNISYIYENEPLGSAGSLFYLKDMCEDIILVFGDIMMQLDWTRMISFHEEKKSLITLFVHPNSHPYDSDLIYEDKQHCVLGIDLKTNQRSNWYDNVVNAGIYIINEKILKQFTCLQRKDLERDIIMPMLKQRNVYAYHSPEYVKDVGTPERFIQCGMEQKEGVLDAKCLIRKQKAFFIDRDGTINKWKGLLYREIDFELEDKAAEAIRIINKSGYLAICVTNQPVVARGLCEIADVYNIHRKMQTELGKQGAFLDDIVFCPHHPDKGYLGENENYKIKCDCRKPNIGMIAEMVKKYNIDLDKSFMIGDSTVDLKTGINAGVKTILVKTGQSGLDGKYDVTPDYIADNILNAVLEVLQKEEHNSGRL